MSLTKELQQWVAVGRTSPEMALRQLDTFGVDWYLTERGDLMIRYWQLGAEGFVSPERVGEIQEGCRPPQATDALEWVSATLPNLRARYAGRWIAAVDGRVIADAASLADLLRATEAEGAPNPFVTQIPAEPIVWNTLYAR